MTIKTLKAFTAGTHIPAAIVRAVVRQVGGWTSFKELAGDVARHGANGGFSGFCYYSDTVPFAKRVKGDLLAFCAEEAREFGNDGAASFIASFNCVDLNADEVGRALYKRGDDNQTEVFNALAWYALETVARAYDDLTA